MLFANSATFVSRSSDPFYLTKFTFISILVHHVTYSEQSKVLKKHVNEFRCNVNIIEFQDVSLNYAVSLTVISGYQLFSTQ